VLFNANVAIASMMSMGVWCNDTEVSERCLSQYHFVDYKFYMGWS